MNSFFKRIQLWFVPILLIVGLFAFPLTLIAAEEEAIFAGGCFWCLEHDLAEIPGVISAKSGYSGGDLSMPTYRSHKGHQEAVKVSYDSELVRYEDLLRGFWRNVDPFDGNGQFCDRGDSYRPVIFAIDDVQKKHAFSSLEFAANELDKPIQNIGVQIRSAKKFWLAEDYHQNYAQRNAIKYSFYRYSCGRDARLDEVWEGTARSIEPWSN